MLIVVHPSLPSLRRSVRVASNPKLFPIEHKLNLGASRTMPSPEVEVVIPTYEAGPELLACLDSLMATATGVPRVTIVDNAPSAVTNERLGAYAGFVEVVRPLHNLGFGAACNLGIRKAQDRGVPFVMLLNQDTTVAPETIGRLVGFAASHPRAGILGPRTLSSSPLPDGQSRLLYAGSWRGWLPLWQQIPGVNGPDTHDDRTAVPVDYIWGHGMLVRCQAIAEGGGFDAAYFMYNEDLDLCVRLQRAGWELWCVRDAVMWHDIDDAARAGRSELWRWSQKVHTARIFHRRHCRRGLGTPLTLANLLREFITLACCGHLAAARHLVQAGFREFVGRPALLPPRHISLVAPTAAHRLD